MKLNKHYQNISLGLLLTPMVAEAHADENFLLTLFIAMLLFPFFTGVFAGAISTRLRQDSKLTLLIFFIAYLIIAGAVFLYSIPPSNKLDALSGLVALGVIPYIVAFYISRYIAFRFKKSYKPKL